MTQNDTPAEATCRYCGSDVEVRRRVNGQAVVWSCPKHDALTESELGDD